MPRKSTRTTGAESKQEPLLYPTAPPADLPLSDVAPRTPTMGRTVYLYRASLQDFLSDVAAQRLVPGLVARFTALEGHGPSKGELTSWQGSLPRLAEVLSDARLRLAHIFVELRMPLGGRRCDVLLSGLDLSKRPTSALVELKAWQSVKKSSYPEHVAIGSDSRQHPSAQTRDYVQFLEHHHSAFVKEGIRLVGCAYLHDLSDAASIQLLRDGVVFGSLPLDYPLFTAGQGEAMAAWLHAHLGGGDGAAVANTIAEGYPCASEKLLDVLVDAVQGTHEWRLLDEQRKAFLVIISAVEEAREREGKTVVLVRGGPGTGKSVLAIQLLAHGARKRWRVVHATGSQAFQTNLQAKTMAFSLDMMKRIFSAKTKASLPVKELFCTFANVASQKEANAFDLVVGDEAHRLWNYRMEPRGSGIWKQVSTTPMVEEMIRASRVTAFFLDDNQSVRAQEIGHSRVIREHAARLGVRLIEVDLSLQFRCNGSQSYVSWVDALLGYSDTLDLAWRRYGAYQLHLEESVQAMAERLEVSRLGGQRCRTVAGFCWPWSNPIGSTLVNDLKHPSFQGWEAPWIEKTEQNLKPLDHRYYRWANDEGCRGQVGSIYSVQGFEFDHVGVIWGEDLVWRENHWHFDPSKNRDDRFKRELKSRNEDPVAKLRNIYRVLLTRGMQSTSLFVIDEETRAKVRSMLQEQRASVVA